MRARVAIFLTVLMLAWPGTVRGGLPPRADELPFEIMNAWFFLHGGPGMEDAELGDLLLRTYALRLLDMTSARLHGRPAGESGGEEKIARHREIMIDAGWPKAFVSRYDRIVGWVRGLPKLEPDALYAMAGAYRAKTSGIKLKNEMNIEVANHLRAYAAYVGHDRAWLELAQDELRAEINETHSRGGAALWTLADRRDYAPAQIELADRYLSGRGFKRSPVKAIYWYLRAESSLTAEKKRVVRNLRSALGKIERDRLAIWIRAKWPRDQ